MTTVVVYLIRHAAAGKRGVVDDDLRPLNERGRRQADTIAQRWRSEPIARIVTSPFTRCVETVVPLGLACGVPVEQSNALAEGAGAKATLDLIEQVAAPTVLCSHGDVIREVLGILERRGVALGDDRLAKGSAWVLTVDQGDVVHTRYVEPPR